MVSLRYSLPHLERESEKRTGNPSITFWKVVYRRYTSFALEAIEQTFNGSVDFGKKVSCTISRNGDLVSTMFLEVTLKKHATVASFYAGESFLAETEVEIGGQRVDRVTSDWLRIHDELFRTSDEKLAYRRLADFDNPAAAADVGVVKRFYIPLVFFFNKNPGLALPLIALQYHEVKLSFTFASAADMALNGVDTSYTPTATLYATYIFLDTDERELAPNARAQKLPVPRGNIIRRVASEVLRSLARMHDAGKPHNSFDYEGMDRKVHHLAERIPPIS